MASTNINKYVTHYPTASSTHLQQYGYTNQQQAEAPKTSYVHTSVSAAPTITTHTTHSELSQDITSLLLKEQSVVTSDSTKRVLQTSSVADYLSHLPTLHHFLKYSAESAAIKKENVVTVSGYKYFWKYLIYLIFSSDPTFISKLNSVIIVYRKYHSTNPTASSDSN